MLTVTHKPVLLKETTEALTVQPGGRYVDCTLGGGGHALAILESSAPGGQLLGIDTDPEMIPIAAVYLSKYQDSVLLVNDNFVNIDIVCQRYSFVPVHGILFDLGLSSHQLENEPRGFSFQYDTELDMRFNPTQGNTAADIINKASELELTLILKEYGEERFSRQIARRIVRERPITTTLQLVRLIEDVLGGRHGKIHPATRTFQAIRIAVNRELEVLETALKKSIDVLGIGGKLVVISYHSLEDRIVKHFMQREAKNCICPADIPVCRCDHTASLKIVSKKVIVPSEEEIRVNPRSRSAKMRVAEKIAPNNHADKSPYRRFSRN